MSVLACRRPIRDLLKKIARVCGRGLAPLGAAGWCAPDTRGLLRTTGSGGTRRDSIREAGVWSQRDVVVVMLVKLMK